MKHEIKLTNGSAVLLNSVLSVPEQFKDPSEVLRAAYVLGKLELEIPETSSKEEIEKWAVVDFGVLELTESQRELVKKSLSTVAGKIPPSKIAIDLLEQFGFTA